MTETVTVAVTARRKAWVFVGIAALGGGLVGFETASVARQLARCIERPMLAIKRRNAELGDQIQRATISLVLNINEASRRIGRDRINRFRFAAGSAHEIRAGLELAVDWHFLSESSLGECLVLLDRLLAMLWRLEHPRK